MDSERRNQPDRLKLWLRVVHILLILAAVATALLILQQFGGIGISTLHTVKPDRIKKADGIYKWQLPEDYRSPLLNLKTTLFEDGVPFLNHSSSARELPKMGPGWFHVFRGNVKFTPPDGSDPRTSKHRYTVRTPLQFEPELWWTMGGLLGVLLLVTFWLRQSDGEEAPIPSSGSDSIWPVVAIFVVSLAAAIAHASLFRHHSDGVFVIKGIQESDAGGWHEMALGLQRGEGLTTVFESQRPLYTVLLGFVYWITQPSVFVGQVFNAVLIAIACAGLWWLGCVLQRRWLGAGLAAVVVMGGLNLPYAHGILTENADLPLSILALLAAWMGAWLLSPKWSLAAGAINGVAAVASGLTLFTLPIYAIWIFVNSLIRRAPWQRVVLISVMYALGASAVILPWMIRQQAHHGHFALSFNTAEVLAGGASPTEGHVNAAMLTDAAEHGVDLRDSEQRFAWFITQYRTLVMADPMGYIKRVMTAAGQSLKSLPNASSSVPSILCIGLLGAALFHTWRTGRITFFIIACAAVVMWIRAEAEIEPPVLLTAAYLAFRRAKHPSERLVVGLLIGTVVAVLLISGLSGNVAPKRFWIAADWSVFGVMLLGAWSLIDMLSALTTAGLRALRAPAWVLGSRSSSIPALVDAPPLLGGTVLSILAFCALATASCLGLTWRGPIPIGPDKEAFDPQSVVAKFIAAHPEDHFQKTDLKEFVPIVMVLTERPIELAAGEGFQHWLPIYNARPYKRWICRFTALDENGIQHTDFSLMGRGSLAKTPQNTPFLCVYANLIETNKITGAPSGIPCLCVAVPLIHEPASGKWSLDEAAAQFFPAPPELLRRLPKVSAQ